MLTDIQQVILEYCLTTHQLPFTYDCDLTEDNFASLTIVQHAAYDFKIMFGSVGKTNYIVLFHHNYTRSDPKDPQSLLLKSSLYQPNSRILEYDDPSLFDTIDSYVKFARQYPTISEYSNSLP